MMYQNNNSDFASGTVSLSCGLSSIGELIQEQEQNDLSLIK